MVWKDVGGTGTGMGGGTLRDPSWIGGLIEALSEPNI